jgi:hypothetical protein
LRLFRATGHAFSYEAQIAGGALSRQGSGPKSQAEHFRAKAVECLERSLRVPDYEYQRLYYELAAQWLMLAHEADSQESQ